MEFFSVSDWRAGAGAAAGAGCRRFLHYRVWHSLFSVLRDFLTFRRRLLGFFCCIVDKEGFMAGLISLSSVWLLLFIALFYIIYLYPVSYLPTSSTYRIEKSNYNIMSYYRYHDHEWLGYVNEGLFHMNLNVDLNVNVNVILRCDIISLNLVPIIDRLLIRYQLDYHFVISYKIIWLVEWDTHTQISENRCK